MNNDLVRYSRAGDEFHYRWAARRCLLMIHPNSKLKSITIEGSKIKKNGEYVIDVAEYYNNDKIRYYQLKHTTVRKDKPFNLSDLKDTFKGFADRYLYHEKRQDSQPHFVLLTNRKTSFKTKLADIARNKTGSHKRLINTLSSYTGLKDQQLISFCKLIEVIDNERDFYGQREELQFEFRQFLVDSVNTPQIDSLVTLVREKALPEIDTTNQGTIYPEDVYKKIGCSVHDLFPAPPKLEPLRETVKREQHDEIFDKIWAAESPIVIEATGGIGKTTFAQQILISLPHNSSGVIYDCFGGGQYLNRSKLRHRHRDALLQIVNELSCQGLCDPLIVGSDNNQCSIQRAFLSRLDDAIKSLKDNNPCAKLILLLDAVDNAEMAAINFGDPCFANELLRENFPRDCKIVAFLRPERIGLLKLKTNIEVIRLNSFNLEESTNHLKEYFPHASEDECIEFHKLTNGNPRIQANILMTDISQPLDLVLQNLGTSKLELDNIIEDQLNKAIIKVCDMYPNTQRVTFENICKGIATLPPFIPLKILAKVSNVDINEVISFINEIGRPLWLTEDAVHFVDEPTETWFHSQFKATSNDIEDYINILLPFTEESNYISSAIPELLLAAEKYDELIKIALSDDHLPQNDPISLREIQISRLTYAFKAAIKKERFYDATKIALRAGEETASDERQVDLLKNNIDLVAIFSEFNKSEEMAHRRIFKGSWFGAENIYSSSILSFNNSLYGEACSYLRSSERFLDRFLNENTNDEIDNFKRGSLEDNEILELVSTYYNIWGYEKAITYLLCWNNITVYQVSRLFFKRLYDHSALIELPDVGRCNPYLVLAYTDVMINSGRLPTASELRECFKILTTPKTALPKKTFTRMSFIHPHEISLDVLISFLEACTANGFPKRKIMLLLRFYFPQKADPITLDDFNSKARRSFLRFSVLKSYLKDDDNLKVDQYLKNKKDSYSVNRSHDVLTVLFPWYNMRLKFLLKSQDSEKSLSSLLDTPSKRHTSYLLTNSMLPWEFSSVYIMILSFMDNIDNTVISSFFKEYIEGNESIRIADLIHLVSITVRLKFLNSYTPKVEEMAFSELDGDNDSHVDEIAQSYIKLARAVLPKCKHDAKEFFNIAIESLLKFSDLELKDRWEAIAELADKCSNNGLEQPETAFRFLRCAELVGHNVYKETYWNRNKAIEIATNLSPNITLAGISRWRDRRIGYNSSNIFSIVNTLLDNGNIKPRLAWCFNQFMNYDDILSLSTLCIIKSQEKQIFLDKTVMRLQEFDTPYRIWSELLTFAQNNKLHCSKLKDVCAAKNASNKHARISNDDIDPKDFSWDKIFEDINLLSQKGLSTAINRAKKHDVFASYKYCIWNEIYNWIKDTDIHTYLDLILDNDEVHYYNFETIFEAIPTPWKMKVSFKRNLSTLLNRVGERFPLEFLYPTNIKKFLKKNHFDPSLFIHVEKGVLDALKSGHRISFSTSFFWMFVHWGASKVSLAEGADLLNYSLDRMEPYIDPSFGDGLYSSLPDTTTNINESIAGYIWSYLASPIQSERWDAVHFVKNLGDNACFEIIEELITWYKKDSCESFGAPNFHFYILHAKLYLLIALTRISKEHPAAISKYQDTIFHLFQNENHALIMKYAIDILNNIKDIANNELTVEMESQLNRIQETYSRYNTQEYNTDKDDSYFHMHNIIKSYDNYHIEYDFERYWYDGLEMCFNIKSGQAIDLAKEIIHNKFDGDFNDSRKHLWGTKSNGGFETSHSHGNLPETDSYEFYLNFHTMFYTASKLIDKMIPVKKHNYNDNTPWNEWIEHYTLGRSDGYWFSDRRDPEPLFNNERKYSGVAEDDKDGIDYLKVLLFDRNDELWINTAGYWDESEDSEFKNIHIQSAFVNPETSEALLNSFTFFKDDDSVYLPEYNSENCISASPFDLFGWYERHNLEKHLEEHDQNIGSLRYPPYTIGESVVSALSLSADTDQRNWYLPNSNHSSIISETWSTKTSLYELTFRTGIRIGASLTILREMCKTLSSDLMISINVRQNDKSDITNEGRYVKPTNKVFLFTRDGKLRDTKRYYKFR